MGLIYLIGLPILGFFIAMGMRMYSVDRREARAASTTGETTTGGSAPSGMNFVGPEDRDSGSPVDQSGSQSSSPVKVKVSDRVLYGRYSDQAVVVDGDELVMVHTAHSKNGTPHTTVHLPGGQEFTLPVALDKADAMALYNLAKLGQTSDVVPERLRSQVIDVLSKLEEDGIITSASDLGIALGFDLGVTVPLMTSSKS